LDHISELTTAEAEAEGETFREGSGGMFRGGLIHTTRTSTNVVGCEPERRLEEMRVKKKGLRQLS